MILGRGTATTDEAIVEEYRQLLAETRSVADPTYAASIRNVPLWMQAQIGKPICQWNDEDVLTLYRCQPPRWKKSLYHAFMSFLFFHGYYRPTVYLLANIGIQLTIQFRPVLAPLRKMLRDAQKAMGYQHNAPSLKKNDGTGSELELYIWFLTTAGKTAEAVTRDDFDSFKEEYDRWYRNERIRKDGHPNAHLFRLEQLLVYLNVIPAKKRVVEHERYFLEFPHPYIRDAILRYLNWCNVKYKLKSTYGRRKAMHYFFSWLCEHHSDCTRLDDVTRPFALEYAAYVKKLCEENGYSALYRRQIYQAAYLFFEFAVEERLDTSPARNPFAKGDLPPVPDMVPRYIPDHELRTILKYCETEASLLERTITITLLHTGIRASELAALKASDMVQIAGTWKLHIHEGKGLKDRVIPLTEKSTAVLQEWMASGWSRSNDFLFTHYGRPWVDGHAVADVIRNMTRKIDLKGVTPHRFRHTFAVALLNYGVRESAIQKLMGHATLGMTLEYARILDETVEQSFTKAVEQMEDGPISWVPSFFIQEDYTLFAEGDSISWIQLPVGFCRRNPKLHCESDVKCFLCERFCATPKDLPRLEQMYERFTKLGLKLKADVVSDQIRQLQTLPGGPNALIPAHAISVAPKRRG